MRYRSYREVIGGDPLDYIAFSMQELEEKAPDRYQQLFRYRLKLTLELEDDGDYSWAIIGGGKRVMHGKAPIKEDKRDSLPIRIHNFLKSCGFVVEENSGMIN